MKFAAAILCISLTPLFADDQLGEHAQAAKAAEARHDYKTAIREYRALTKLVPDNPQLRTNLAIALYLNGDSVAALAECQTASRLSPDLFPPHLFAGLSWFRLGKPDQAAKKLARAIQINRSDPVAHLWLGYAEVAQSRYEPAIEQFKAALGIKPDDIDALYALGKAYLEMGRMETERLLAVAPDGGRAWQLAAEQCRMRGERSQALEFFRGAYERRPDLLEIQSAIRELGGAEISANRRPVAVTGEDEIFGKARGYESLARETFAQIGEVAPDSYRAHEVLADSLATARRSTEAIAEYRVVVRVKPDLPAIHQAIGKELLQEGHTAEAVREFEAELALQPQSATVHVDLARALLLFGNEVDAEKHLRSAIHLDRPPAAARKLLAKASLRRQDYRAAIPMLEEYIGSVPDDSSAHYLLARAYRAVNNTQGSDREMKAYQALSADAKNRTAARRAMEQYGEASRIE